MVKSTTEFQNALSDDSENIWSPIEGFDGQLLQKVINRDGVTKDTTRLVKYFPGVDTSKHGPFFLPFPVEYFVVSGTLLDLSNNKVITQGNYASFSANQGHGPYKSEQGCMVLEYAFPSRGVMQSAARQAEQHMRLLEKRLGIAPGGGVAKTGESLVFEIVKRVPSACLQVFDVGANIGQYAEEAIARLGEKENYQLHCFEPSIESFSLLEKKLQHCENVKLNHFGLSDAETKAVLYSDKKGSKLASLTKREIGHFGYDHGKHEESVSLSTLEAYCTENDISHIDLLKIDVEGHELDVLTGGLNMLKSRRISLVQFEFGGCNIDTRTYFRDFYTFFVNLDFVLFRILPNRKLLRMAKYRESDEKFQTTNYLACSSEFAIDRKYPGLIL